MTMACPLPPVGATVSSGSSALGSRNLGANRRAASDSAGISAMVIDVTVKVKLDTSAADKSERGCEADADEGELAAGAEQQAGFDRGRPGQAEDPGEADQQDRT